MDAAANKTEAFAAAKRDHQNFMRHLTEAEKAEYTKLKGPGSAAKKKDSRELLDSQKLKNATARQSHSKDQTHADTTIGTYRNFWMIAEKEGGLMDRAIGIRVATEICSGCERRGPPATMWDPAGKILKYLHCEVGMSDSESTMRQNILNADVDMPEESVIAAMQQGKKEGLVSVIPEGVCGKLADYAADVPSKGAGNEDPETTHPKGLDLSSPAKATHLDPMANMIELIKTSIATSSAAASSSQAPSS